MATKKKRSVMIAVLTLMLCLALAAGGSYALFSDEVVLHSHLEAGTMDITLVRTKLEAYELNNDTGFMEQKPVDKVEKDFSGDTTDNVFGFTSDTLIVPMSEYKATMEIRNNEDASDVAFKYWMEIKLNSGDGIMPKLAEQVEVIVTTEDGTEYTALLSNGILAVGSETNPVGVLAKKTAETFTVSLKFKNLDNEVNNSAKGNKLSFDLYVYAVQEVKNPNAPAQPTNP